MLYTRLVGEDGMQTIKELQPTLGYNFERMETVACNLNIWDVGGAPELMSTWNTFYLTQLPVSGIIFVVNLATPHSALLVSAHTFLRLLRSEHLDPSVPFALVYNLHASSDHPPSPLTHA